MTDQPLDQQPDESAQTALSAAEQPDPAQEPTEAENGAQNGASEADEPDERDQPDEPGRDVGREAARYRRKLRTVEAERDALEAERDQLRQALLHHRLGSYVQVPGKAAPAFPAKVRLRDPDDAARFGVLDGVNVWTDDGKLDDDAIAGALTRLHEQRPELFTVEQRPIPTIGMTPLSPRRPAGTWEAAFTPRSRR